VPLSRVEVDLRAIEHNVGVVRRITTPAQAQAGNPAVSAGAGVQKHVNICGVLKQDAYGLGAVRLARRLVAAGVEMLAVFTGEEAGELIEAAVSLPIMVLAPVREIGRTDPMYRHASAGRLHLIAHEPEQLASLTATATRLGLSIPVHIFVDTGMSRGGSRPDAAEAMLRQMRQSPRLRLAGAMTHFASPDTDASFTNEQAKTFHQWLLKVKELLPSASPLIHAANTIGMLRSERYHGTMVRVGQGLYGYGLDSVPQIEDLQFGGTAMDDRRGLEPAVRWVSSVVQVVEIPEGWPVGYGSTWKAPRRADGRPTRIAVVPVGYADGYPRALSGTGMVGFTGKIYDRNATGGGEADSETIRGAAPGETVFAPIVGRVSMDQITVDVTDVPAALCGVGMEVELLGRRRGAPNFLASVADAAGSITHELLCRISPRVERVYKFPQAAGEAAGGAAPAMKTSACPRVLTGSGGGGIGGAAAVAR
jgi:alanine racemase